MKALFLNSGVGRRMGELVKDRPKGMTDIGMGYTILSHQLEQAARAGIREAVITTGPFADALRAYVEGLRLPIRVEYAHNPDYLTTNYIVSMHLAAPMLRGHDVYLSHGDVVLEDGVLRDLLAMPQSAVAVDSTLPLPDKDFKALMQSGRVVKVGVTYFGEDCAACQPVYRWRAQDFGRWLDEIAAFVARGETSVYAEDAFNALAGAIPLAPMELRGRLCNEIDDPDDLRAVGERFRSLFDRR